VKDQAIPTVLTLGVTLLLLASRSLILRLGNKKSALSFVAGRILKITSSMLQRRAVSRPVEVEAQIRTRHFPRF